jgi:hypothetical protein
VGDVAGANAKSPAVRSIRSSPTSTVISPSSTWNVFVLVVVDVQRGRGATRVFGLDLGEAAAGLFAAGLDGKATRLPPDVGESLAGCDAVRLSDGLGVMAPPSGVGSAMSTTVEAPHKRVS